MCICTCAWSLTHVWLFLCDPMDCNPPGSSVHGDSPGKNTGVGCHALHQGIFPTQGSNPGFPHCRRILYHLSHQGSQRILEWVAYPSPGELPDPGIKLGSLALQADYLPAELPGKPECVWVCVCVCVCVYLYIYTFLTFKSCFILMEILGCECL